MQQIPFIDLFIGLFKSAVHVSGDKLLPTGDLVTMSPVGSNIAALYHKLYIQSKSAPEDGRVCHPKHVELI